MIPQNKIDQSIAYKHLLTAKQKQDILNALQTGGNVTIRPTRVQSGGLLDSLLASIGIPPPVDMIGKPLLKAITGKGASRLGLPKSRGGSAPQIGQPPPFIGTWEKTVGRGRKKISKGTTIRQKQPIELNSNNRTNIKPKFHINIQMHMSNHHLI